MFIDCNISITKVYYDNNIDYEKNKINTKIRENYNNNSMYCTYYILSIYVYDESLIAIHIPGVETQTSATQDPPPPGHRPHQNQQTQPNQVRNNRGTHLSYTNRGTLTPFIDS